MACGCAGVQSAAAVVLILITFVFGFIPLLLKSCLKGAKVSQNKVDEIVSVSLVFGAGVLFATSVQHMLFESRESIDKLFYSGFLTMKEYPLAELFFCLGFVFIYAFEETIVYVFLKDSNTIVHSHSDHEANHVTGSQIIGMGSSTDISKQDVQSKVSFLRIIIFMFALYMHTLFEGLAVGIAETSNEVWILTGAIAAHKIFIAFSTGNELMSQSMRVYLISIGLLALMPTLGTVLGVVLAEEMKGSETGDFLLSFLTGFSGGVILFVVFCEILEKERAKSTGRIQNMIAFAAGFACMAGILVIPEGIKEPNIGLASTAVPTIIETLRGNM